jgi:two-component system, chemotaxis family, sensor kinase CheA
MIYDDGQPSLLAIFVAEAQEHLQAIKQHLPLVEKWAQAEEGERALREMFRAAHTLKGAAGAAGVEEVRILAHQLEVIFGQWRSAELAREGEIFDLVRQTLHTINLLVRSPENQQTAGRDVEDVYRRLLAISGTVLPSRRRDPVAPKPANVNHEDG